MINMQSRQQVSLRSRLAAPRAMSKQAGMTILEILIVLAIIALVMGVLVGPRVMRLFGQGQADVAKLKAEKYKEAYTIWSASNPGKKCPATLADLQQYMDAKDDKDPWGNPFKMMCGASAAAGSTGFEVMSPGQDGKEGTADDIKTWDDKK